MSSRRSLPVLIALVVGLVVVAVGMATCGGGSDGPAAFLSHEPDTAIFVQWTRVGNDVSGTVSEATQSAGEVKRATAPFTGTVRDDSVRLQIGSEAATGRINGRLDGSTLELTIPQDEGVQTRRLAPASKDDYTQAVQAIRDREQKREQAAQAAADREYRAVRVAVVPVATAFQKALDPASSNDPCRYLRPQLKRELVARADANARSGYGPAGRSCATIVRDYESELHKGPQGIEDVQISDATNAIVVWRGDSDHLRSETPFTKQNGRWLVNDCCSPGGF
jgi:hypothetical protein